ncbi:polysaccharide deacetylase family protein [Streptococcus cristatus]|uniref:polysaccharide deacetylase family protein n=1 Tax=Streptococcus cristatus TaxID=45634 RepID=UPI000F680EBA|nr:polysaccharide deacetylase family protein [Streptococcus cristatus]RSJ74642.1 Poly-beta-1,6-N-acetyl-D-glucosamine N-deacetylase precursor [Streptococcus cristatus]
MTDKHIGRRMQRHKAKKKAFLFSIINLFLLLALIVGGIYLWKTQFSPSKQSSAGNQTVQSTSKPDSTSTNEEASKIKWVKQDEPVKIPILMYHAIHVIDPSEAANAGLIVDPTTFESHLQALKEAGYYTLTPDEAYKALTENVLPENKKVVWLTFDDSLKDFYTNAFPLLQKYQMKATNNVITGFVQAGREDMLTLDEIKEMKEKGMSFEDHTVNHPDLSTATVDQQTLELADSKAFLDDNLSQTTTTVAYPSGRYSDATLQIAESLGYKMGLTTNNGLASLSNGLLSLSRVRVNPTTTAEDLLNEIATS